MSNPIPQPEQPGSSVLVATFAYNAWANRQLLDFCAGLSDEQLAATTVGGYGTIRATLGHLVYGEVSYVSRVNGKLPPNPPSREEFSGFDVLRAAVEWANAELLTLALAACSDTLVVEVWPEGTERYKLVDLMVQASSHAMEHRTQVAAIITALGLEPPDLSTWAWMEARGAQEFIPATPS
ncbi:MAG: DinB family protein [Chloroflexota bacterium]|nr:DinB family protein [Chloroflexota bacterium]